MDISSLKKQKDFFNSKKNQYQLNAILNPPLHTREEINEVIRRTTNIFKKNEIIDFGAGSGRLTIPLLKMGYKVIAVDISTESLKNLQKLSRKLKLQSIQTERILPKKMVNLIVGTDILHHVELSIYLPKLQKMLNRGGKIVFSEPGGLNPSWYIYLPLFIGWEVERGIVNSTYFNLQQKLTDSGFSKINIQGLGLFPRPFFNWFPLFSHINDWLGNLPLLKQFAYRYIIEAYK